MIVDCLLPWGKLTKLIVEELIFVLVLVVIYFKVDFFFMCIR